MFDKPQSVKQYANLAEKGAGPADCIGCGQCEEACPQHLEIRRLLQSVAAEFKEG